MQPRLGKPSPMVMTARHLAKGAPSFRYSVEAIPQTVQTLGNSFRPGCPARSFAPPSTLMPGMMPRDASNFGEGRAIVLCRLPNGFVIENHAADERVDAVAGDQ